MNLFILFLYLYSESIHILQISLLNILICLLIINNHYSHIYILLLINLFINIKMITFLNGNDLTP